MSEGQKKIEKLANKFPQFHIIVFIVMAEWFF